MAGINNQSLWFLTLPPRRFGAAVSVFWRGPRGSGIARNDWMRFGAFGTKSSTALYDMPLSEKTNSDAVSC